MSLNIVLAASLMTAVSCSDSSKSKPGSSSPITGYWKEACDSYPVRTTAASSGFYYFQILNGTTKNYYAQFESTDCTGPAFSVNQWGDEQFTLGTVISASPLTQQLNFTRCEGDVHEFSTLKYEGGNLHFAKSGGDGASAETRYTDFATSDVYYPLATADVPQAPVVSSVPLFCLQ